MEIVIGVLVPFLSVFVSVVASARLAANEAWKRDARDVLLRLTNRIHEFCEFGYRREILSTIDTGDAVRDWFVATDRLASATGGLASDRIALKMVFKSESRTIDDLIGSLTDFVHHKEKEVDEAEYRRRIKEYADEILSEVERLAEFSSNRSVFHSK